MEFAICPLAIAAVRKEPTHRSEMVTQVLFGELFRITARQDDWVQVVLMHDQYEGWIASNQIMLLEEQEFLHLNIVPVSVANETVDILRNTSQNKWQTVVLGSSFPGMSGQTFSIKGLTYQYEGQVNTFQEGQGIQQDEASLKKKIVAISGQYLTTPYLWGGRSPFGIDCSGFTQMVFKLNGIKLLRDAAQQSTQGEQVSFIAESEPGDLAFFDNEEGLITHVGILIGKNRIIHAFGSVKINEIDHHGIFHSETHEYTHKLRLIKRLT
jgi:gamma-D-glutamyl-L-lysine dipeptidyl-peptidase